MQFIVGEKVNIPEYTDARECVVTEVGSEGWRIGHYLVRVTLQNGQRRELWLRDKLLEKIKRLTETELREKMNLEMKT